jgi:hypothetical protein
MTDAARSVIKGFNFQSAHTTLTRLERKWNMDSISASRSEYRTPTIDEFKAVANDLVIEALGRDAGSVWDFQSDHVYDPRVH